VNNPVPIYKSALCANNVNVLGPQIMPAAMAVKFMPNNVIKAPKRGPYQVKSEPLGLK